MYELFIHELFLDWYLFIFGLQTLNVGEFGNIYNLMISVFITLCFIRNNAVSPINSYPCNNF